MTRRELRVKTLMHRIGPIHTLVLVGYINQFPSRYEGDGEWFNPAHGEIIRELHMKEPVYWQAVKWLENKGLIHRQLKAARKVRVDFLAIEKATKWARLELFIRFVKNIIGRSKVWKRTKLVTQSSP
jgi:hypothetical protein